MLRISIQFLYANENKVWEIQESVSNQNVLYLCITTKLHNMSFIVLMMLKKIHDNSNIMIAQITSFVSSIPSYNIGLMLFKKKRDKKYLLFGKSKFRMLKSHKTVCIGHSPWRISRHFNCHKILRAGQSGI